MTTNLWYLSIYFLADNLLRTNREQVGYVVHAMVLTLNILILTQMHDALLWLPIVSNAGSALFAVIRADYMLLAREIGYLLLALETGLIVLLGAMKIVEARAVGS